MTTPTAPPSTSAFFRMDSVRSLSNFLVRRRVAISFVLFSSILATELLLDVGWHRVDLKSDILFGTAVTLVLLGMGIRSWAAGTISKNAELASVGAYSLCRHPLYLGSFLMVAGACLGTQPLINFPIVTPFVFIIYVCTIRSEETKLAQSFGDEWKSYSAKTSRLIPNLLRSKLDFSSWSAKQWLHNREYEAMLATIAGVGGMFAWYMFG